MNLPNIIDSCGLVLNMLDMTRDELAAELARWRAGDFEFVCPRCNNVIDFVDLVTYAVVGEQDISCYNDKNRDTSVWLSSCWDGKVKDTLRLRGCQSAQPGAVPHD